LRVGRLRALGQRVQRGARLLLGARQLRGRGWGGGGRPVHQRAKRLGAGGGGVQQRLVLAEDAVGVLHHRWRQRGDRVQPRGGGPRRGDRIGRELRGRLPPQVAAPRGQLLLEPL